MCRTVRHKSWHGVYCRSERRNRIAFGIDVKQKVIHEKVLSAKLQHYMSITSLPSQRADSRSRRLKPTNNGKKILRYKNPKVSIERRIKDLLSRMTVQEKADQM